MQFGLHIGSLKCWEMMKATPVVFLLFVSACTVGCCTDGAAGCRLSRRCAGDTGATAFQH